MYNLYMHVICLHVSFTILYNIYITIFDYSFDDYTKIGNIVNSLASRLSTQQLYKQVIISSNTHYTF